MFLVILILNVLFIVAEDADLFDTLLNNEKQNFKLLYEKMSELGGVPLMLKSTDMTNTIPDEKVVVTCVTYLCGRLLDVRHESRAARTIQLAWRGHRVRRAVRARQVRLSSSVYVTVAVVARKI